MSVDVTVTGGTTHGIVDIGYSGVVDQAYVAGKALASAITAAFQSTAATIYDTAGAPPPASGTGYLVALNPALSGAGGAFIAKGYSAIAVQNGTAALDPTLTAKSVKIVGGATSPTGTQSVLAGNGGLNYTALEGSADVVALGGNNAILLKGNGILFATTGDGNDTITGGSGINEISAGLGSNVINLTGSSSQGVPSENEVITSGVDSISNQANSVLHEIVTLGGSAFVNMTGGDSAAPGGYVLTFQGSDKASTVIGSRAGAYSVSAGDGGGYFVGGLSGNNFLAAGDDTLSEAVTLLGVAGGDTLIGSYAGSDSLVAGKGAETLLANSLMGSGGADTFVGGTGSDYINLEYGSAVDTVVSGSGSETVDASNASAYVTGGISAASKLTFIGGDAASTVLAGSGSDTITAGSGGGLFYGATGDGVTSSNYIHGGGTLTIFGGAGGDTLSGGDANNAGFNSIVAGTGNETLIASNIGFDTLVGAPGNAGVDTFDFTQHQISALSLTMYDIQGVQQADTIDLPTGSLKSYTAGTGAGAVINLTDGTKITLDGYSSALPKPTIHD